MKLSRNKIAKLLKTGNQSRRRFRSKSLTNKDLILDVNTSRNNTSLTPSPAKTKAKTAAKTEKKHRQSMKKKRRGLNLRYKTLKRWGGAGMLSDSKERTLLERLLKEKESLKSVISPILAFNVANDESKQKLINEFPDLSETDKTLINNIPAIPENKRAKPKIPTELPSFSVTTPTEELEDVPTKELEDVSITSEESPPTSTTSTQIKTFIQSILDGSKCEFIDVAFVPHLTTYINSDAKYKKPYNSISQQDEALMGFPYPQPTSKATSTDKTKFEEGLGSAPPAGGGAMSGGLSLTKNPLDKLNDIKTNLYTLNEKIEQYTTFFNSSLNDYSQTDINLNDILGGSKNLHNRQLLQKILKEGNIVYEKNVFVKTYGKDNTKIKRDVFDKGDYKFFNELIKMQSTEWDDNVKKSSGLLSKQNLFDLLTKIATRMNDVDAGQDAGIAITKKIVESIPQITLENIVKKSFLGIIALFLSIYTGFNKCQEDFDEWKKNSDKFKDRIDIQKIYQEIEKTLAKYKTQFDEGTIGGISEIRTTAANTQMNTEINEAKDLTTTAIMNNPNDDPTTNLTLIEKLKIKYYLQYLAYSFIVPNGNLLEQIKKNQCINILNKIKNIVTNKSIPLPSVVVVAPVAAEETVPAPVETLPAPVEINAMSIDALIKLFTDESISGDVMIARKKKLTELLTPKGALYEAIYILEANLNFLRARTMSNRSVQPTTTNIYELLEYVIGNKDLNNIYEHQSGGGVEDFDSNVTNESIDNVYKTLTDVITDKIGKVQSSTDKTTIDGIDAGVTPPEQSRQPQFSPPQLSVPQPSQRSIVESSGKPSAQPSETPKVKSIRSESVRNQPEIARRNMNISPQVASTLYSAASTSAASSEQAPGEIVGLTLKNEPSSDIIFKLRAIPPQAWASTTYNTTEGNILNLGADMMGSNDRDNTNVLLDILRTEKALDDIGINLAGTAETLSTGNVTSSNLPLILTPGPDAAAKDKATNKLDELKPMIEKFKEYLKALKSSENKQGGGGQVGGNRETRPSFNNPPTDDEIDLLMAAISKNEIIKELFNGIKPSYVDLRQNLQTLSSNYFRNLNPDQLSDKAEKTKWKKTEPSFQMKPSKYKNQQEVYAHVFDLVFQQEVFEKWYDNGNNITNFNDFITKLGIWFKDITNNKNNFGKQWTKLATGLSGTSQNNDELLKQIAQLEKDLAEAKKQIEDLQGQLKTLNEEQNKKEKEINQLKAEAEATATAVAAAQTEIDRLTAEQNKKKSEHDAALKLLNDERTRIETELAALTSENDKNKTEQLQRQKAESDANIKTETERFKTETASLTEKLTALQAQLEQKNTEAEQLNATNAALIKTKEEELAKINQEKAVLQSQIDAANSTNTKSNAKMDDLKKQLEESQKELGTTKSELEITKKTLGEKETEYAGACARNDAKVTELEQLNQKLNNDLKEAEKKNFDSQMSIIKLLEYHIKRYVGFQEKIKSLAPASVEVLPESASNLNVKSTTLNVKSTESTPELKDESATVIKGKSITDPNVESTKPKYESATSKLGDGNPSSSSGKKTLTQFQAAVTT